MASPSEQSIQDLRRELLAAESRILELQDQIAAKQTEQADAVALLGDAELVLENKITYIVELDRTLNLRIRQLEQECDLKTEEIENRGKAINAAKESDERNRADREAIIAGLNTRIESANQEINQAHAIARDLDLKRAELTDKLEAISTERDPLVSDLNAAKQDLAEAETTRLELSKTLQTTETDRDSIKSRADSLAQEVAHQKDQLGLQSQKLNNCEAEIFEIKSSLLWKLGKPWRVVFGPKS